MKPQFTHCLINGVWHECRIFKTDDFIELDKLGENEEDGEVFIAVGKSGEKHILK